MVDALRSADQRRKLQATLKTTKQNITNINSQLDQLRRQRRFVRDRNVLLRRNRLRDDLSNRRRLLLSDRRELERLSKLPTIRELQSREKARLLRLRKEVITALRRGIPSRLLKGDARQIVRRFEDEEARKFLFEKNLFKNLRSPKPVTFKGLQTPLPTSKSIFPGSIVRFERKKIGSPLFGSRNKTNILLFENRR